MFQATLQDVDVIPTIDRLMAIDFGTFLKQAGDFLEGEVKSRLAAGVNPDGSAFEPLHHKAYMAWKEKNFQGLPVMTLTGELLRSITETMIDEGDLIIGAEGEHTPIPSLGRLAEQFPSFKRGRDESVPFDEILTQQEAWGRTVMGMSDADQEEVYSRFVVVFDGAMA